ncbi:hypothetical protein [Candidatus Paracaedibacter symbiosus]|uniref:hypothetical protein n=1 Tax=Candidatus Paracaedibacter symbiosus TaxID=244582 RepID=UPI0012EC31BE|nr:hypothetical protein [Candidatus Paracaedibacter symbiosus]
MTIRIILLYAVFCVQAMADSMMLSPAELEAIGMATDEAKLTTQTSLKETGNAKLRLDGIVFSGEESWCVWLNGQRFSYGENPSQYKIVKVCHDRIEMIAADQGGVPAKTIVLSLGSATQN